MNLIFLLFLLGLPTFVFFLRRFFSFRKFNIIRSKRLIVQILSYEICLILILIVLLPLFLKINLESLIYKLNILNRLKYFLGILFFILILTESSRIPFDFVERESELVSGFNTEYSRTYFSIFFIYEYGIILFFSILIRYVFLNFILSFLLIFLFIHIRRSFPRLRYDQIIIFF
jgi:NADH:ubiquinone oxidoreductase subunit H